MHLLLLLRLLSFFHVKQENEEAVAGSGAEDGEDADTFNSYYRHTGTELRHCQHHATAVIPRVTG